MIITQIQQEKERETSKQDTVVEPMHHGDCGFICIFIVLYIMLSSQSSYSDNTVWLPSSYFASPFETNKNPKHKPNLKLKFGCDFGHLFRQIGTNSFNKFLSSKTPAVAHNNTPKPKKSNSILCPFCLPVNFDKTKLSNG